MISLNPAASVQRKQKCIEKNALEKPDQLLESSLSIKVLNHQGIDEIEKNYQPVKGKKILSSFLSEKFA